MTIYDEIIKLRDSARNSLNRVNNFPKLVSYGSLYTATLVADGNAVSEVFKFNPNTYASEGMEDVLLKLVDKSGLVPNLQWCECTEGTLDHLLVPEYQDDDDEAPMNPTKFYNGVTCSSDRRTINIPGTSIRYTVKPEPVEGKKRRGYTNPQWNNLDESVVVVINAISEWKDPEADAENKKKLDEWLLATAGDVGKAHDYLTALNKLVEKAMSHK